MKSEYENQLKGAREKADQIILDAKTRAQEEYNNKRKQPEPKQIICLRKQRVILQMSGKGNKRCSGKDRRACFAGC